MGEEGKHARFNLSTGTLSARGVAFNANGKLEAAQRAPHDIAVRLEVNHWNGAVEPRAVLADAFARGSDDGPRPRRRHALRPERGGGVVARFDAELAAIPPLRRDRAVRARGAGAMASGRSSTPGADRRSARIAELLSSGERVMVVDRRCRPALGAGAARRRSAGAVEPACVCLRCPDGELERCGRRRRSQPARHRLGDARAAPGGGSGFQHLVLVDPRRAPELSGSRIAATGGGFMPSLLGPGRRAGRALLGLRSGICAARSRRSTAASSRAGRRRGPARAARRLRPLRPLARGRGPRGRGPPRARDCGRGRRRRFPHVERRIL